MRGGFDVYGGWQSRGMEAPVTHRSAIALEAAEGRLREALTEVEEVQREIDALQAERARRIERARLAGEQLGLVVESSRPLQAEFVRRSTRAELAIALRVSEWVASRLMDEASILAAWLPGVLDAAVDGRIPWRAVRLIAMHAAELDCGLRAAFGAAAIEVAAGAAPARLTTRLVALRERFQVRPASERHTAAKADRRVEIDDVADGMSWLRAYLPSVEAHGIDHRLTDLAHRVEDLDAEDGIDDPRTIGQRRADLLVDFLVGDYIRGAAEAAEQRGAEQGGADTHEARVARGRDFGRFAGIRPTVGVTVPVQALLDDDAAGLLGPAAEPPMLDGTVPIDPATARQLAANAPSLRRLLVHPQTGARLGFSRDRYAISTDLRMWLRLRDQTCRFPGCGRLARGCDIDHSIDWQFGGETAPGNLAHLCRGHHTLKHQTRWGLRQHSDGTITWRAPSGRIHTTSPPGVAASRGQPVTKSMSSSTRPSSEGSRSA